MSTNNMPNRIATYIFNTFHLNTFLRVYSTVSLMIAYLNATESFSQRLKIQKTPLRK